MIKVGFAKQDLEKALRPEMPVREERVEAVSMYIASHSQDCIWTVLDFMDFDLSVINALTEAVHKATGTSHEHIHILTTHNHGGGMPDIDTLAGLTASCALSAKTAAVPSVMRYAMTRCDKQVNYTRRKYIPELKGSTTIYYGPNEDEKYDASPFIENTVQSVVNGASRVAYTGRLDTGRPYDPFESADNTVFAVEFADADGHAIGSIVRFAAHAVCCNHPDSFSSDYPYHIRKNIEAVLGGTAMFFNGPCADIAPGMRDKYDGSERRLGEYIARIALDALKSESFKPLENMNDRKVSVPLAVRECVTNRHIEQISPLPESLPERKQAMEHNNTASWMSFLWDKYSLDVEKPDGNIEVSLGILDIGDITIAAYPGETFAATARALCEEYPGKAICTVTEHGRTAMYMPPSDECDKGGYETVCRTIEKGQEEILRSAMIMAVRNTNT